MGMGIAIGVWDGSVMRASSWPAISGIAAMIISYRLVKKINKSNLWARLFDETELVNDIVEEKKVEVEKEGSYNWKLISIVALVLVAIMVISNTFFFPEIPLEQNKVENKINTENLSLEEEWAKARDRGLSLKRYNKKSPEDPTSDVNDWCIGETLGMYDCSTGKLIKEYNPEAL